MQAWLDERQRTKAPLPEAAYGCLRRWRDTGDEAHLYCATFRHVVDYLMRGAESARLDVALADIGYTRAELRQRTLLEIADEVLARGVDDSD